MSRADGKASRNLTLRRKSVGNMVRSFDVVDALCVVLMAAGIWAWSTGIVRRAFDYDEYEHAHVIWLIKSGLRPFYDFFECHPPFLWYPLAGVLGITGDSYNILYIFRAITGLGHILSLVAICKNVALSLKNLGVSLLRPHQTFILAVCVIAGQPAILEYLLEFRLDAWPQFILLISIWRYRRAADVTAFRPALTFGLLATAAMLCSPKLLLFLASFVVLNLAVSRDRVTRALGMAAGAAGTTLLSIGILLLLRLNPLLVFRFSITYHQMLNSLGGFGPGLLNSVRTMPGLLWLVAFGIVAWAAVLFKAGRARLTSAAFEISVLIFLAAQLKVVTTPYKQYYGPWFLLAALCFLPYIEASLNRLKPMRAVICALAVLCAWANIMESQRRLGTVDGAGRDIAVREQLELLVPPKVRVVAPAEVRPIFRRDALYHIATSFARTAYDTTLIMEELKIQPMSSYFSEEAYLRQMDQTRPGLVLDRGGYTSRQKAAVDTYLRLHAGEFHEVATPDGPAFVRNVP
ncbi:MAG: hypothetical protein ABJA82_06570 [Myxococcales bacterium]